MAYESIIIKQELVIDRLISIHYFEYMCDFSFTGESHDFWELLCVDKGTVNVLAGDVTHTLNKDDVIFHKPGEFHTVSANGIVAPNLVVISFECHSNAMAFFEHKILKISALERNLLGSLISEASQTYSSHLDDPYCEKLTYKNAMQIPFGSEQLIQAYLIQFLILLTRKTQNSQTGIPAPNGRRPCEDELFYKIISYMEDNIDTKLTIRQICEDNLISRSILQKLFHDNAGCGIIDYFNTKKIHAAKQLMRNRQMNFSQIADELGYGSIHYFSRHFKKETGMTPSEYVTSIKQLSERTAEP